MITRITDVTSAAFIVLALSAAGEGATIRVPADAPTIQQGIDAAVNGDTALVSPGTYYERINFHGKAITVASEQGPDITTIDGGHAGTVVTFLSREGRDSVLSGFTIRNGFNGYSGAGIHVGSSSPTTRGNYGCGWGGGIASTNYTQATLIDNLIVRNSACFGGGVQWDGTTGMNLWVNNTIADNDSMYYPGLYIFGYTFNHLYNNIITAASGPAVFCEYTQVQHFYANDVFSSSAASWGGSCTDQTGLNGNISGDPAFIAPAHRDYRLKMTSSAIDAGDDTAPQLPGVDLGGGARVFDGDGDSAPRVDMGAFEYHNHAPTASAGPDQTLTLGSDCAAGVTLTATASDPDGDALTYTWTSSLGTTTGATISLTPPVGTYTSTITVDDGNGAFASDTV